MKKRIATFLLCLALCFTIGGELLLSLFTVPASAEAVTNVTTFADTSINDDLANIDLSNYPVNPLGECDVISFMEFCYTEHSYYESYFGLYVYVYNPTAVPIMVSDDYNFVNFRVGNSSEFEKLSLEYLDKTSDRLFYKFRIKDSQKLLSGIQEYANSHDGARRYEIIELEIRHEEQLNASSSDISKCYEWNGYAAYCGEGNTPISTLTCKDYGVRSIHLNLKQTNYRFATQTDGYTQDELNSVFFTIPEDYFQDFGNLDKISAEWYEYKTDYMFVTSDAQAYSGLWDMRGIEVDENGFPLDESLKKYVVVQDPDEPNKSYPVEVPLSYWRVLFDEYWRWGSDFSSTDIFFGQAYNGNCRDDLKEPYHFGYYNGEAADCNYLSRLDWLFYTEKATGSDAYRVSKDEVTEYIRKYTNDFRNQELIRGKYASDLFIDSIDSDRIDFLEDPSAKSGHVKMEFSADVSNNEGNSFIDADSSQNAWNKFWFGTKYETVNYSPIAVIKEGDLFLEEGEFSSKYYVNEQDVKEIIENAKEAYDSGERPVLLRFAVTDYYASTARFDYAEENSFNMSGQNGYVAQETVFLDFDVISLGFRSADGYSDIVIGVVAEPIDIINGLTPPEDLVENQEWWQKIMMVLGLILIVVLLVCFGGPISFILKVIWDGLKFILKLLLWVLSIPFKLIGWLFKPK